VTRRDRYILIVVGLLGLVGAYWMLALAPKREKLSKLNTEVAAAKQTLEQSKQEKVKFAQAQVQFPKLYATLGRLGKAVPADEDVPSLLVQLNHAAAKANVDFRSVELKLDLAEKLGTGADAAAAASASAAPAGGAGTTGAQGATGAAGATSSATASPGEAPAGGAAAAPATLQPLPFEYKFKGDFFHLESLIHNVSRLVESRNREVSISGRLVVIQGFSMTRGKVTIIATTYMLPADQGLFGGATPAGPAGVDATTPQPASAGSTTTAPPSAAVTP
jgi:Pilus assembly protein, PilO